MHGGVPQQVLPQPQVAADLLLVPFGDKAAVQESIAVQLLDPLAVLYIGLPSGDLFGLATVDQPDVKPSGVEDIVKDEPIGTRGLHRNGVHTMGEQIVQGFAKVTGKSGEGNDLLPLDGDEDSA